MKNTLFCSFCCTSVNVLEAVHNPSSVVSSNSPLKTVAVDKFTRSIQCDPVFPSAPGPAHAPGPQAHAHAEHPSVTLPSLPSIEVNKKSVQVANQLINAVASKKGVSITSPPLAPPLPIVPPSVPELVHVPEQHASAPAPAPAPSPFPDPISHATTVEWNTQPAPISQHTTLPISPPSVVPAQHNNLHNAPVPVAQPPTTSDIPLFIEIPTPTPQPHAVPSATDSVVGSRAEPVAPTLTASAPSPFRPPSMSSLPPPPPLPQPSHSLPHPFSHPIHPMPNPNYISPVSVTSYDDESIEEWTVASHNDDVADVPNHEHEREYVHEQESKSGVNAAVRDAGDADSIEIEHKADAHETVPEFQAPRMARAAESKNEDETGTCSSDRSDILLAQYLEKKERQTALHHLMLDDSTSATSKESQP